MADTSNFLGQVLGLGTEKEEFFDNETSQLLGFEIGLNGDADNLFPDESKLLGVCLGIEVAPFINHSSKIYLKK